jgi:hypothetical protein
MDWAPNPWRLLLHEEEPDTHVRAETVWEAVGLCQWELEGCALLALPTMLLAISDIWLSALDVY